MTDLRVLIGVPGAGLLDDAVLYRRIDHLTPVVDPLVVEDLELGHPERRRHLVLHHLHPRLVADHLVALLDRPDAPDIQPHRGVELEGVAAGGGLGVAEHHPDLHTDLVDEHHRRAGLPHDAGELAQGLAHQPRLEAHVGVPHVTIDLRLGHQGRHRVDHDQVDGGGAHQGVDDLQGLFTGIGLGDEQVLDPDPEALRVVHVQGVLRIDERAGTAEALGLGDHVQGEGGFARRFRTVDLRHPAAGDTTDPQGRIEDQRPGGDRRHRLADAPIPEAHDCPLTELPLDLRQGRLQGAPLGIIRHDIAPRIRVAGVNAQRLYHSLQGPESEPQSPRLPTAPPDMSRK